MNVDISNYFPPSNEFLEWLNLGIWRTPSLFSFLLLQFRCSTWTCWTAPACIIYCDEWKLHQTAIHLKSTPVSILLPALVKTKPALGTPSMVKVEPASPGTPADKISLGRSHVVSILEPSTRLREIKMFVSDLRQGCVDSSTRVDVTVMGGSCNGQIIEPYSCNPFFMAYSTPKLKILVPISISSSSAFQRYPNFPILINY